MKNEVKIFDISYDGAGVGKLDGKVVFVLKTLPGEVVGVQLEKENSKFSVAKIKTLIQKSLDRQKASCPYFEICGGCDFQHCTYEKEKNLKTQIVLRELQKIGWTGKIEFEESENRFFYRNKIKLEVFENKLGYFKRGTNEFFEIKTCPIATRKINEAIEKIENFLKGNQLKNLKNVYFKQVDDKLAICFLFDKNAKIDVKNLKNIEILHDFLIFFAFGEVLESNSTKIIQVFGKEKLTENLFGQNIENDISAFNQVNDFVAERLYDYVCQNTDGKNVINAYSGQGLLTALISKTAKSVFGIEYQKSAHLSAEKLKNLLKQNNMHNICGKVENEIAGVLKKQKIDFVVLDPARAGCQKSVLEEIKCRKIPKILYISCNFSSLVRDLQILKQNYTIKTIKIFDMFPCTANVETVAILERV